MSFIGNLFKRKPGGTMVGNLLRGAASSASGGMLGQGTMMISQQDADKRDLSDADYEKKYGQSKAGQVVASTPLNPVTGQPQVPTTPTNTTDNKWMAWMKKPAFKIGAIIVSVGLLALLIIKKVRKGGRRY